MPELKAKLVEAFGPSLEIAVKRLKKARDA
jgi:hypothetical protein